MSNSDKTKEGDIYTSSDPGTAQTEDNRESLWNNFNSSTNAISFGFVATLIVILMFIIMVIFEHLFRPTNAFEDDARRQSDSTHMQKLGDQETVIILLYSSFLLLLVHA
ncbi:unnamed protein product [Fraxinus pennsylvanica]|uniref:Uncharacterized protein n=1 Tax=Fraxinus pennsylvanica TaxID=56036 RepID=A0AAD1Z777_9LAMI|nr:unnamed protein product [Fraxinus pennsylvanica]